MKQTAMQQLLNQMREERTKLPLPIEWDRCYQAIEMMIEHTYIPMEKEQKLECWNVAHQAGRFEGKGIAEENWQTFEQYYNETYEQDDLSDWDATLMDGLEDEPYNED